MVVVMIVVDWGAVVVLLSVSQGLLRVVSEVRHVLLVLVVGVVALVSHWIIVVAVETAVMHWAVIEVLTVVVGVVVAVLHLVMSVVQISVVVLSNVLWLVMVSIDGQVVVHIVVVALLTVVLLVHMLDVVVAVVNINVVVRDFVMLSALVLSLSFIIAVAIAVMAVSWLVVSTSVWVVSVVAAFASSVVPHWLIVGVVLLSILVVGRPAKVQVFVPAVIIGVFVVTGSDVLILGTMAILVVLERVFVLSTFTAMIRLMDVGATFDLVFALVVVLWAIPLLVVNLGLVVVVLIVVGVRRSNLSRVCMVVGTLGDYISLLWPRHCEVQRSVLLISIVISVILMAVHVLRCHMVVAWVLIVVRVSFFIVVLRSGLVVASLVVLLILV